MREQKNKSRRKKKEATATEGNFFGFFVSRARVRTGLFLLILILTIPTLAYAALLEGSSITWDPIEPVPTTDFDAIIECGADGCFGITGGPYTFTEPSQGEWSIKLFTSTSSVTAEIRHLRDHEQHAAHPGSTQFVTVTPSAGFDSETNIHDHDEFPEDTDFVIMSHLSTADQLVFGFTHTIVPPAPELPLGSTTVIALSLFAGTLFLRRKKATRN